MKVAQQDDGSSPSNQRSRRLTIPVAYGYEPGDTRLGLHEHLPLLGGGTILAPTGLASQPGMEHLPGFRTFVAEACRLQSQRGHDWYAHRPLAIVGDDGIGVTLAASWLSRSAGVPMFRFSSEGLLHGACLPSWMSKPIMPPMTVVAMAAARCANPVILVEAGSGELNDEDAGTLATMIDPRQAGRWFDDALGAVFDLSHVSWIIQVEELPDELRAVMKDHGTIMTAPPLGAAGSRLRNLTIAAQVCEGDDDPARLRFVFDHLEDRQREHHARIGLAGVADLCRFAREGAAMAASTRTRHGP